MEPFLRPRLQFIVVPIVNVLARWRFNPNTLTFIGLLLNCVAGLLISQGFLGWGGFVMTCLAMPLDGLDGPLARKTGTQGKFGAFWDSTLDRYAESALLVGLVWYFLAINDHLSVVVTVVGLVGSLMVSYCRARAESLGLHGEVGLFSRFGRFVLLAVGLFVGALYPFAAVMMVWLLAVLSNITAMQRMMHISRIT
jgi:CDP-diacylglycerol--glycerol-3-phosphate 3-phosphatidyltransferase